MGVAHKRYRGAGLLRYSHTPTLPYFFCRLPSATALSDNVIPMTRTPLLVLLALLSLFVSPCPNADAADTGEKSLRPRSYYATTAKLLARRLPQEHLMRTPLDDDPAAKAWQNYLSSLDYLRVFFLQADIVAFEKQKAVWRGISEASFKRGLI